MSHSISTGAFDAFPSKIRNLILHQKAPSHVQSNLPSNVRSECPVSGHADTCIGPCRYLHWAMPMPVSGHADTCTGPCRCLYQAMPMPVSGHANTCIGPCRCLHRAMALPAVAMRTWIAASSARYAIAAAAFAFVGASPLLINDMSIVCLAGGAWPSLEH